MKGETKLALVIAVVLIVVVIALTTGDLHAKLRTQLDVAAGSGDQGAVHVSLGGPVQHRGMIPAKWEAHVPAFAHSGRHRMYHHPARCSPYSTAPHQVAYDWLYCPPSEGDL